MPSAPARENLTRFAWLSIAAALATIALKFGAYVLTGSVGLLSDAAESVVNLVAAFVALIALHVAAQPADEDHQFGHSKAEYFSAAVEGVMIFVAAAVIGFLLTAVPNWTPRRSWTTSGRAWASRLRRPRSTASSPSSSCGLGANTTRSPWSLTAST